jgi:hypothetical protein
MKHQETVREFYRRQGEERERQRILKLLAKVIDDNGKDSWLDVLELIKYNEPDTIETGRLR